jgi:membrane-bound lytic murein transglycosylase B
MRGGRTILGVLAVTLGLLVRPADGGEGFAAWLEALRRDAAARGVSAATLDATLSGLAPIPAVLELDRRQPEVTLSYRRYLARLVTPDRVQRGRARLREHRERLVEVAARSGVPPAVLVALWGVETDYGVTGREFPVVAALATLAHEGRRSALFRDELLDALRMVDEGHVGASDFRGSWAGATGQSQFLPSSFLRYAVDADGDGRRDIWRSLPDVFASIANYLVQAGWRPGQPWRLAVRVPPGLDPRLAGLARERPPAEWQRLGLRALDAPERVLDGPGAALLLPDGPGGPAFLAYENLRVLMRWNRSSLFALAVGELAERLEEAGGGPVVAPPPDGPARGGAATATPKRLRRPAVLPRPHPR